MPRFFVDENQINNDQITIVDADFNHMTKSLRVRVGEKMVACDGVFEYNCTVEHILENEIILKINEKNLSTVEPNVNIHVYISVTKSDKMELVTQKVTELGAFSINPFFSSRCIVKLDQKARDKKNERLSKIAHEASKQSGRAYVPEISDFLSFEQMLEHIKSNDVNLTLYENEENFSIKQAILNQEFKNISVIIGPEGGFDQSEIEKLSERSKIVTLGKRILRAETAPIAAVSVILYETDNLS